MHGFVGWRVKKAKAVVSTSYCPSHFTTSILKLYPRTYILRSRWVSCPKLISCWWKMKRSTNWLPSTSWKAGNSRSASQQMALKPFKCTNSNHYRLILRISRCRHGWITPPKNSSSGIRHGHHIPIIAFTAAVLMGDRERFLAAGMDDYIAKPIDMQNLYEIIQKHTTLGEKK